MDKDLKPGKYRHFKGEVVEVLFTAKHSETLEDMVVYRALYACRTGGVGSVWVRPKSMFCETVQYEGKTVTRFTSIEEHPAAV